MIFLYDRAALVSQHAEGTEVDPGRSLRQHFHGVIGFSGIRSADVNHKMAADFSGFREQIRDMFRRRQADRIVQVEHLQHRQQLKARRGGAKELCPAPDRECQKLKYGSPSKGPFIRELAGHIPGAEIRAGRPPAVMPVGMRAVVRFLPVSGQQSRLGVLF